MVVPQTEITVTKDGVELARRVVTPGEYLFGRGEDVDFHMDTPLASRHHARLYVNYDEWLIEDLASANGTFINDHPVAPNDATRVFPTQTLRVGDATVTLRRLRGSEAPDVSLAPSVAAGRTLLPEEVRARRYAIGKIVAQGGMGAILSAQDQAIRRSVAMKVMLQSGDTGDLARFVEEAQITGQLEHPNIVPVHELGVDEQDQFFYTMKFVRGITLKKVLELITSAEATAKKYPLGALLTIFQKVCDAIAFAHAKGVIHRDLKPENIMLGDFGEVLVMDWGLAKVLGQPAHGRASNQQMHSVVQSVRSGSTLAGTIMGTPQFMSPEQARGEVETLDARSDIYALGAILFQMVFLRPPCAGNSAMEVVDKVGRGELDWTPPKKPAPDSLLAVCRKALAFDREQRYASVEDLQRDLTAYQTGFATGAERASWAKRATLAIKRNKAASIGAAAVLLVGLTFGTKAVIEGRRAAKALATLRQAAPSLAAEARGLVAAQKLDEAADKLAFAITIDPQNAGYLLDRANYLQAALHFQAAADAYRRVLALRPEDADARENLALCERLTAGGAEPDAIALRQLYDALRAQHREVEAVPLGDKLGVGGAALSAIKVALGDWMKLPDWNDNRIISQAGGKLQMNLSDLPLQNLARLAVLAGKPIDSLRILKTGVADLTPIAGIPLTALAFSGTPVADLTPVSRMPLVQLEAAKTFIRSIEPLRGKAIRELDIAYCPIDDYSLIPTLPLEKLSMSGAKLDSLELLRGLHLTYLFFGNAKFKSLEPLRGMPLTNLAVFGNPNLTSLEPLRGMPLRDLDISGSPDIQDVEVLNEIPTLTTLAIFKVRGFEKLRNHPGLRKIGYTLATMKPVAEFWAEYDAQQAAGKK